MQAAHNCVYKLDQVFRVIFVGCWLQLQPRMRFYPMQYLSSVFSKFYRDYLLMRRWCVLGSAVKTTGQCLNWWIIVSSCSRSVSCQHWPPVWMLHQSLIVSYNSMGTHTSGSPHFLIFYLLPFWYRLDSLRNILIKPDLIFFLKKIYILVYFCTKHKGNVVTVLFIKFRHLVPLLFFGACKGLLIYGLLTKMPCDWKQVLYSSSVFVDQPLSFRLKISCILL